MVGNRRPGCPDCDRDRRNCAVVGFAVADIADDVDGKFIDLDKERARLKKEIEKLNSDLEKINSKLENQDFMSRASDEIIGEQKSRKEAAETTLNKLSQALKQLAV